ncbi:GntR family transcriptional regulator [Pseudochrobactrum algeriensis]|uniref:GntR family transcriptional regulator n=1 Tax=Pseudochrobactrum algeriensis TaxID=2834768 RepID=UPI001BD154CC|nr:GntR family transcriptional regulator [Pseudochrobactrum algeriensis]MBX8814177.1 GntR family transcriptional regulator [Ochrobactrum sp. MR34]QVQ36052.1 GntR family transcriptional regulator [Pseudochrobactrum algeriensis]QVQ39269.1 GntR family transcriptional regulator [Pseudochrobactrum algeriensis]QVQ43189.1 GntR family transcriptional regulator [Pseudochrobactrum algeriensis]
MDNTRLLPLLQRGLAAQTTGGPLYKQVSVVLTNLIEDGSLAAGSSLPPERELAQALGLARVTIRSAYQALLENRLVERRHGSGTYICERPKKISQPLWQLTSFSQDMIARGKVPGVRILSGGIGQPSPEEAFQLGISMQDLVVRVERLRLADDMPMAIERAVVPQRLLGTATLSAAGQETELAQAVLSGALSLYTALEQHGYKPVRALQRLTAVVLDPVNARLLGVADKAAALQMERVSRTQTDRIVEYTRSLYRGDAYDFIAELKTGGVR